MQRLLLITVFVLSIVVLSCAKKENWVLFGKSESGETAYYDAAGMKGSPNTTLNVWVKVVPSSALQTDLKEVRTYVMVQCNKKTVSFHKETRVAKDGRKKTADLDKAWQNIAPQSPIEELSKVLCKK